jgi:WD40 repeat protein
VRDRGRLLFITGAAGIGKTWFALKLTQVMGQHFTRQVYHRLQNYSTPLAWLTDLLHQFHISPQPAATLVDCIDLLVKALTQTKTCLIVDAADGIYRAGALAGTILPGWEVYNHILDALRMREHQSCVLWLSCEVPRVAISMAGSSCRLLPLTGLSPGELSTLAFWSSEVLATPADWQCLSDRYGGIPGLIQQVVVPRLPAFRHQISLCLAALNSTDRATQTYLAEWLAPLSSLEESLLTWLMISHRPLSLEQLGRYVGNSLPLAALESLRDRGLCRLTKVQSTVGWELALPDLLSPYLRDRWLDNYQTLDVESILDHLNQYPLLQADAPEMVRQWQRSQLLGEIAEQLAQTLPTQTEKSAFLTEYLRSIAKDTSGYRVGNLINLAQYWQVPLVDVSFQGVSLRAADLQSDHFQGVSFAGADFADALLAKPLGRAPVIAMNPDPLQPYVAVGDYDGRLMLWHCLDGRLHRSSMTCSGTIRVLAYSPDGGMLAVGGQDGTVQLWDWQRDCEPEFFTTTHGAALTALAFSPDGQLLLGSDDEGNLFSWRVASGEQVQCLAAHVGAVLHLAISPTGDFVATCGQDRVAREWHLHTGKLQSSFQGRITCQLGAIAYLTAISETGYEAFVLGYDEGQLVQWEIATSRARRVLSECEPFVRLALSPDGQHLAVSDMSTPLVVWNLEARASRPILLESGLPIETLVFSCDGTHLITGSDYQVHLWQVDTGSCLRSWYSNRHPATKLAIAHHPPQLLSSHDDRTLRSWQFSEHRQRWLPHTRLQLPGDGSISTLEASLTGRYWAVGADTGQIHVWQTASEQWLSMPLRLPGTITAIAFSPQEQLLAAGDDQGNLGLWNVIERIFRWQKHHPHSDRITTLAFSPEGQRVYSGSGDRMIQGWDFQGTPLGTLMGHRRRVHTLCVSPDGNTLYSGSYDGTLRRWNLGDRTGVEIWQQGDRYIHTLALDPQGNPIALISDTQTLEVCNLDTLTCTQVFSQSHGPFWHVSVSPDGQTWMTGIQDGDITLGSLITGNSLGSLRVDRPYEAMNISGCTGLSESEREVLYSLGAIDF